MKCDKLYGFYNNSTDEVYFQQRFEDLQNLGYILDMITISTLSELATRWGIDKSPTMVLGLDYFKGAVLEGGYPSDVISDWLDSNDIVR